MTDDSRNRQRTFFPDDLLTWATLPNNLQQAVQEILSLMLEQVLEQQATEHPVNQQDSEVHHV